MKVVIFFIALILSVCAFANEAQVGLVLGSTAGLSAKFDLGGNRAIDGVLAYSTDSTYGNYFHIDYLFDKARQFPLGNSTPAYLYYGPGIKIVNIRNGIDSGKTRIAFRGPIGLNFQTTNPNLEIFGELAPSVDLSPNTSVYVDVGVGVRFRF